MKIKDLVPGTLLQPEDGFIWVVTPWRGSGGDVVGNYLKVVSLRYVPSIEEEIRDEKVLFLGDTSTTRVSSTPGKQVVLAWGEKMTIDPASWRNIKPIS